MLKLRTKSRLLALWLGLLAILLAQPGVGVTQSSSATTAQTQQDAAELAKKLSNPVASLISVPFQSNFEWRLVTTGREITGVCQSGSPSRNSSSSETNQSVLVAVCGVGLIARPAARGTVVHE